MHDKNDGGPAFPGNAHHIDNVPDPATGGMVSTIYAASAGLSMRDYFAAKAMPAFISNQLGSGWPGDEVIARYAYEMADAMLRARSATHD